MRGAWGCVGAARAAATEVGAAPAHAAQARALRWVVSATRHSEIPSALQFGHTSFHPIFTNRASLPR
eukprot:SAG11_NODE_612_length_8206_cov_4.251110_1_plen_67_part_00